jgi:hypothetical protein
MLDFFFWFALHPKLSPDVSGQPQNVLAREIQENLERFPHCLLLTRVGQFYEVRRTRSIPDLCA